MGKVTWNTSAKEIDDYEDEGGGSYYEGPVPPASVYRFRLAELKKVEFRTGSGGLRVTLDVDDPRPGKKQYNGARAWENVIDLESTTFKIKQFLSSIGATGKDWANTMVDSDDLVTKIGRVRITDDLHVKAATKLGKDQNGNSRMEIARFLPLADEDDDASDDADDTDSEEPPF